MTFFDKLVSIAIKPWSVALFPLGLFLLVLYGDKPISIYFSDLHIQHLVYWISKLGLGLFYLVGFLVAALFCRYIYKNKLWEARFWFLWLSTTLTSSVCVVLKILAGRARPDLWFWWKIYGFYGFKLKSLYWSFPSGHTSTIMGVAFGLAILFPRYEIVYMLLGLLVAVTRIILLQHFLSDILAATWLALLEVALLRWFLVKYKLSTRLHE